jgi:transcriptional antiterminator NusG
MFVEEVGPEEVPVAESDAEYTVVVSASQEAGDDGAAITTVEAEVEEAAEEVDVEAAEEVDAEAAEEIDAEAAEEIDVEAAEEIDVEAAEEVDAEAAEEIDAEAAEEIDVEAAEEIDVEAAEEVDAEVAEEVDAEAAEPQDNRLWYVVHCYSGYENKVKHNLEQRIETMQMQDQIFQVVVPTEDEMEVRDGKRRVIERRVFPGYILVQMILTDDSWFVVRNTPGVTGFVGMGNEPTPLRPEEVNAIMKRMEAEAPKIKVTFKSGQKVRIIDGPFNEFIGVVDEIDMERAKVRVLVSFFGRETPVELDFLQVEKT